MSFYTSLTGLNSATKQLAVTSNNIANVGTSGFKRSRADFGDIFSTSPLQKASAAIGQGVSLKQVSQEFSQGNVSTSGNSLDLAITGDGFFPLKSSDGLQDIYTRNGAFTLNDQNNVVNGAGQRLQAASVDSSGKADLSNLSALTIPPKTSGEAVETTKIQLGLNLPAESAVIYDTFDRSNPATYNKSTALTVYDSGGNGYLATVYYVRTQSASQASPESKWQTYFYIGDTLVRPELAQATDNTLSKLYVNKYGTIASSADVNTDGSKVVTPPSGKTEMYTLDQLTDVRLATPAAAVSDKVTLSGTGGLYLSSQVPSATIASTSSTSVTSSTPNATDGSTSTTTYNPATGTVVTTNTVIASGSTTVETTTDVVEPIEFNIDVDGSGDVLVQFFAIDGSPTRYDYTNPTTVARQLEVQINNALGDDALDTRVYDSAGAVTSGVDGRRFGIKVTYDATAQKYSFSSGSTGDGSTINITPTTSTAGGLTKTFLGLSGTSLEVGAVTGTPERGEGSDPAVLVGATMTQNTTKDVTVGSANNKFYVNVDGVGNNITLATGQYSMADLCSELESAINGGNGYDGLTSEFGRKVSGVTVSFNETTKQLSFTTATMGDEASIQVSGSADWGLDNTVIQFGKTSSWTKLTQYTENGAAQYVKNGVQTEDSADVSTNTEWWPVYLDRGELSFDLTGKPVSPLTTMGYETAFLAGGKGALTLGIDFTSSTQYSSPFAVLSQSQDGAPEGELMGLDIGVDGLVSATYSNGSQNSLGKIVLANFSSPTGLRQVGDASYLASATSGTAKIGEAGSAGYGSIRAGATERANVDLTQELVDLITAQRNFQANAKAIETSSTMTSAIINIRA